MSPDLTGYDILMGLRYIRRVAEDGSIPPSERLKAIAQKATRMLAKGGWEPETPEPDPEDTRVVVVATEEDWNLICATNGLSTENSLSREVQNEVLKATWEHQDGYGTPGFTPPQGWDWSGIRDSSEEATPKMADAIRRVLAKHNITRFQIRKT